MHGCVFVMYIILNVRDGMESKHPSIFFLSIYISILFQRFALGSGSRWRKVHTPSARQSMTGIYDSCRRVLRRPIWGYSVCLCPIKKPPGVYGLNFFPEVRSSYCFALFSLISCLTYTVNFCGYVGTVSYSNHTFPGKA